MIEFLLYRAVAASRVTSAEFRLLSYFQLLTLFSYSRFECFSPSGILGEAFFRTLSTWSGNSYDLNIISLALADYLTSSRLLTSIHPFFSWIWIILVALLLNRIMNSCLQLVELLPVGNHSLRLCTEFVHRSVYLLDLISTSQKSSPKLSNFYVLFPLYDVIVYFLIYCLFVGLSWFYCCKWSFSYLSFSHETQIVLNHVSAV